MMRGWRHLLLAQWSVLMALVIGLPWFGSGYVLRGDMVWVPDLDVGRRDVWGLGPGQTSSVPHDAVVALLQTVVDPEVLQRVLLLGALVALGIGAGRLVGGLAPSLALATVAVWNPFVTGLLLTEAWPLVAAAAGLAWIVVGQREGRTSMVVLGLAATALSPLTAVLGVVLLVVVARSLVGPLVLGLLVNAPTIAARILRGDLDDPREALEASLSALKVGFMVDLALGAVVALALAWGLDRARRRVRQGWVVPTASVVLAVLALLLTPSLANGADGRLDPREYDRSWAVAREAVSRSRAGGDLLVRPLAVERRPEDLFFDRPTRSVVRALDRRTLAREGIGLVLVRADDAAGAEARRDVRRLDEGGAREVRLDTGGFRLFEVPGARAPRIETLDRVIVVAAWVVAGLAVVPALLGFARRSMAGLRPPVTVGPRTGPRRRSRR